MRLAVVIGHPWPLLSGLGGPETARIKHRAAACPGGTARDQALPGFAMRVRP